MVRRKRQMSLYLKSQKIHAATSRLLSFIFLLMGLWDLLWNEGLCIVG